VAARRGLLAFEPELYTRRTTYFSAIERPRGHTYRPGYDTTPSVRVFSEVIEAALDVAEKRLLEARERAREVSLLGGPDGLSERQAFVLSTLAREKRLTRGDYMALTGAAPITATRDLNDLVRRSLLRVHGRTRTRYYTLP
jgi:Fic family protein